MRVQFTKTFRKQYKKAGNKTMVTFDKRLALFIKDPYSPTLHNHALQDEERGLRSINITGDWRALYSSTVLTTGEHYVTFEALGTHSQLYR